MRVKGTIEEVLTLSLTASDDVRTMLDRAFGPRFDPQSPMTTVEVKEPSANGIEIRLIFDIFSYEILP